MKRLLTLVLGLIALAVPVSPAAAQEYSSGCEKKPCPVITTPVEAYGVHPPGSDCCCKKGTIVPYYAPLSPTATCYRYRCLHLTPYYCGYCAKHYFRKHPQPPYGSDGGWGPGPGPDGPGTPPFTYGPFTGAGQDDTRFWRMGGNGLVPYGAPQPPRQGPPDIVDMIQMARGNGGCLAPVDGAGPAITSPAVMPPAEAPADREAAPPKKKAAPAAEEPRLPE